MASRDDVQREREAVSRLRQQVSDGNSEALREQESATDDYYATKLREERARLEGQLARQRKQDARQGASGVMERAERQAKAAEQAKQATESEGE